MARLSAVVVVDSDPKGLESLVYGFEGEGCRTTALGDPDAAVGLVTGTPPQLVVIAARAVGDRAVAVAQQIRQAAPGVRVLVLGPASVRDAVRAVPGIDHLPLPAFVRDVITAAKLLVALPADGSTQEGDIQGALSEYGFYFLVRTIVGLGRSAIVQVERASRRGEVRFSAGQVSAAQAGSLQGSAALHHLLLWEEAALEVKFRPNVRAGQIKRPEELLQEAERFLRDFAHATKDLGPPRTIFLVDHDKAAQSPDAVPVEIAPVLRLFDGQRSLGEVIEDSPFRVFDTLRIVSRLLDIGVLSRKEPAPGEEQPHAAAEVLRTHERSGVVEGPVDAASAPAPAAPPPAAIANGHHRDSASGKELRTGPANRRKAPRRPGPDGDGAARGRGAPEGDAAAPQAPATAPQPAASGNIDLQARGEIRASKRELPSVMAGAPSVVVDMGPADLAPPAEPPAVVDPAALIPTPPPVAATSGVMRGRTPTPSPDVAPARSSTGSIELDPALMEELDRIEMANTPATPPPLVIPPAVPPLTPPPAVVPAVAVAPVAAMPEQVPAPVAPVAQAPVPTAPLAATPPPAERRRRPNSGEFSALEADFFAREAEIYKEEGHAPDSFDDLDPAARRR